MAHTTAKQTNAPSKERGNPELALQPSAAPIIDIGVNLAHKQFQSSLPDIISRAFRSNVTQMIITGTTVQSSRVALGLTQRYREPCQLFSTAGTHPHYAKDCAVDWLASTRRLLEDPRCVAVGETGLDFNRNFSPPEVQEAVFEAHLLLAAECGKPLFCHEREAHARFLAILDRHPEIDGSRCPAHPSRELRPRGPIHPRPPRALPRAPSPAALASPLS